MLRFNRLSVIFRPVSSHFLKKLNSHTHRPVSRLFCMEDSKKQPDPPSVLGADLTKGPLSKEYFAER